MSEIIETSLDRAIVDILAKVGLTQEQDEHVRLVLRNLWTDAYDEGYQDGYDDIYDVEEELY